ncbi:MAG: hypothetical protein LBR83_04410 [Clostridiales bacterium]|jgi:hypothetical protein|nr:hypothetical protein [Clostridiales bacterium]
MRKKFFRAAVLIVCSFLFAGIFPAAAEASEPKLRLITFDEALALARKDSSEHLALQEQIDAIMEKQDELEEDLRDLKQYKIYNKQFTEEDLNKMKNEMHELAFSVLADDGTINQQDVDAIENALDDMDRNMESLKLGQQMIPVTREISLRNALKDEANALLDIELMEATLVLDEENVRRVTLKNEYGLASSAEVREAEQTLAQNQKNLEALNIQLENYSQAINEVLQLSPYEKIRVTYIRTLSNPPANIEVFLTERLLETPSLKQKEIETAIKKAELDYRDSENKRRGIKLDKDKIDTLKVEYDKLAREYEDRRIALEAAIRANFSDLEALLKKEETLTVELEKANDTYETALIRLNAGQVTQYDADLARLGIKQKEIEIEKNKNDYWTLKFMFDNPFLLVA